MFSLGAQEKTYCKHVTLLVVSIITKLSSLL